METNMLTMTAKLCKECGEPVGPGRADKEFCDPACKTSYNNRRKKEQPELSVPEFITRIQEIQLKNRSILETLCTVDEPGSIRLRDLHGKGFNPKFFTSEAPTEQGDIYRFCFEYGYKVVRDKAIIICREREVL